jgi:hypothetical protein
MTAFRRPESSAGEPASWGEIGEMAAVSSVASLPADGASAPGALEAPQDAVSTRTSASEGNRTGDPYPLRAHGE